MSAFLGRIRVAAVLLAASTIIGCGPAQQPADGSPAASADSVIATWGAELQIDQSDYASWLRWRQLPAQESNLVQFATGMVLAQAARQQQAAAAAFSAEEIERQVHLQVLGEALSARMAAAIEISVAEADAAYAANPDAYTLPRRYQLSNLFLALPESPAAQAQVRARMKTLHERALAGADFAELARESSQSQTRFRDGRVGLLALRQLPPKIAALIEPLQAGQISPIIEAGGGLSIYYCEKIHEASAADATEVRQRVHAALSKQAVEQSVRALDQQLLDSAGITIESRGARLRLRELRAAKATAMGLDQDPAVQVEMRWRAMQQLAKRELDRRVEALRKPAEAQLLRQQFQALQTRGEGMVRYHVAGIAFGPANAGTVEAARRVFTEITAGELTFSDAARAHSTDPTAQAGGDLGWFNVRTLAARDWAMMRAIRRIDAGELTGVLNTDDGIWIYRLDERQAGSAVAFEDVQSELAARAHSQQSRTLEQAVQAEIVNDLVLIQAPAERAS